jgi:hypothetical protein
MLALIGTSQAQDFINGACYIKSASESLKFSWINQTGTETNALKVGKTYASEKSMFSVTTQEKQQTTLHLSSGLIVQVSPNSEFRVDAFNQMIADATNEPEALRTGDFILNAALMEGSAYFVAPNYASSNTMCVLQTPLMNLELNGGKYHIKTSLKYTFIYVLDGSIGIFDNQTNKKTVKKAGTMVLIFPSPMKATDTMITEKVLDTEETRKLVAVTKELEAGKSSVSFVVIAGKIVGIKL